MVVIYNGSAVAAGSLSFGHGAAPPIACGRWADVLIIRSGCRLLRVMQCEWIATLRYLCCFLGGRSRVLAASFEMEQCAARGARRPKGAGKSQGP